MRHDIKFFLFILSLSLIYEALIFTGEKEKYLFNNPEFKSIIYEGRRDKSDKTFRNEKETFEITFLHSSAKERVILKEAKDTESIFFHLNYSSDNGHETSGLKQIPDILYSSIKNKLSSPKNYKSYAFIDFQIQKEGIKALIPKNISSPIVHLQVDAWPHSDYVRNQPNEKERDHLFRSAEFIKNIQTHYPMLYLHFENPNKDITTDPLMHVSKISELPENWKAFFISTQKSIPIDIVLVPLGQCEKKIFKFVPTLPKNQTSINLVFSRENILKEAKHCTIETILVYSKDKATSYGPDHQFGLIYYDY